jgi:hypothetical protein
MCLSLSGPPAGADNPRTAPGPAMVPQGPNWTQATRLQFYSQDQGSQIMPLVWFEALQQPNGEPFVADSLSRYGYLPNPASPTPGLPVGFTVNGSGNSTMVGMTCAACHTRQIHSGGAAYQIDGGPAIVDFQSFLADLDTAVATVLGSDADFADFAASALAPRSRRSSSGAQECCRGLVPALQHADQERFAHPALGRGGVSTR